MPEGMLAFFVVAKTSFEMTESIKTEFIAYTLKHIHKLNVLFQFVIRQLRPWFVPLRIILFIYFFIWALSHIHL